MNRNDKKKLRSMTAGMTAMALLMTGTFAWNAFDQQATNKTMGETKSAGARLHDDFDGTNKDVYVENYVDEGGDMVFARIRLDEYMEVGTGAGTGATGLELLRGDKLSATTPVIDDVSTWDTYLYGSTSQGEDIRKYRDLEFGGDTIYMPTFNKHIYNLDADINGTLEGGDGDILTPDDAYDDYQAYTSGQKITANAKYATEEQDETNKLPDDSIEVSEEHTAKPTLTSTVVSMAEWKASGAKPGPIWVYDTDGWAYWAQGIEPQTATGLLLTGIDVVSDPTGEWFYAINVVSEMATAGDWGTSDDGDGFFGSGITDDAKDLFDKIAGLIDGVNVDVSITSGQIDLAVGDSISLDATVTVPSAYASDNGYTWSIKERSKSSGLSQSAIDATFQDGTFTPVADMVGNTYTLIATADLNFNAKDSVVVSVYDVNDTANVYVTLTAAGNVTEVEAGTTLQFAGTVHGLVDTAVNWSVTGGTGTTAISDTGLLTVDEAQADASTLTVRAEANANSAVFNELPVNVTVPEPEIGDITPGSDDTVTIDGVEWYVLETTTDSQGKEIAKIFAAQNIFGSAYKKFDNSTNVWENSEMRNTTLVDWINGSPLKNILVYDHPDRGNADYSPELKAGSGLEDAVFLLSQAEYNKVNSDGSPYLTDAMKSTFYFWWVRTPGAAPGSVMRAANGTIQTDGNHPAIPYEIRPALWVYL